MSEMKHTPGPWGITDDGNWLQANGGKSAMVGDRFFSICVSATSEEDKRLIAAAPDFLQLAHDVLKLFSYQGEDASGLADHVEAKARAAIAKAEGRS